MVKPELRARQRLADRLKAGRGKRSQAAFAAELGWPQSKVAKIETGRQLPDAEDVAVWAEHCDPAATGSGNELALMLNAARAEYQAVRHLYDESGGVEGVQDTLAIREAAATRLAVFQPMLVPALLQLPEYARQVIQVPDEFPSQVSADDLARGVAARVRRQAILHEPGRDITLLIGEAALWTQSTDWPVHILQLEHLARLAGSLPVTVGVIPFSQRMPFASVSGFTLYDDTVRVETLGGDLDVADPVDVEEFRVFASLLRAAAVTGGAAAKVITEARNRIVHGMPPVD